MISKRTYLSKNSNDNLHFPNERNEPENGDTEMSGSIDALISEVEHALSSEYPDSMLQMFLCNDYDMSTPHLTNAQMMLCSNPVLY